MKEKEEYFTENNLRGKVKFIRESSFGAVDKFGEIYKGKKESECYISFNDHGNIFEEIRYNCDGTLLFKDTYYYSYDKNEKILEKTCYNSSGFLKEKITYNYNSKGNLLEESRYNSDGDLYHKCSYKYDTSGNKLEKNEYNSKGYLLYKYTYVYDFDDNLVETLVQDSEGYTILERLVYNYDTKGNLTEVHNIKNTDTLKGKYVYKYDQNNNEVENKYYPISDSNKNEMTSYEYQVDEKGNWIKRTEHVGEHFAVSPKTITEREIEYYHLSKE